MLQSASARVTGNSAGRRALVVAQVALSLTLLASAGLITRSLLRMNAVPIGIDTHEVLTLRVTLPGATYRSDSANHAFFAALVDRLRARPEITRAATASFLPLTSMNDMSMDIGGRPGTPSSDASGGLGVHFRSVSPGYFAALGIALDGRDFAATDTARAPTVAIINRKLAQELFPRENPIGQQLRRWKNDSTPATIVGLAADVRFGGPASEADREIFLPEAQYTWSTNEIVVRGHSPATALLPVVRQVVRSIDPNVPVTAVASMDELFAHYTTRQRFYSLVFGVFAATALILSAIGLYGIVAYAAVQRRREIAIRIALGADARDVVRRLVGGAAVLIAAGVAVGALGAVLLTRTLTSLLFEVPATDPATFVGAAVLLGIIGLAASLWPALSARRVAPAAALRAE